MSFNLYPAMLSRVYVFKVEDTAFSFTDIKKYNKALNYLSCSMNNPRVSILFEEFNKVSTSLKSVNSLRVLKNKNVNSYNRITQFFKVLQYSKKQPLKVREKLLTVIKKLGDRNGCRLNDDDFFSQLVSLEVFFESRFRMDKKKDFSKGLKAARSLIESIERQMLTKDFKF